MRQDRDALVEYAWVATRYAVATAVAGFGRDNVRDAWISDLEYKLLIKTTGAIPGLPYHPDGPPAGKRKSTVAYLAEYATLECYTQLTKLSDNELTNPDLSPDDPDDPDDATAGDRLLAQAWKQQELNDAAAAEQDRRTKELEATTTSLLGHLANAVDGIAITPHRRHSPACIAIISENPQHRCAAPCRRRRLRTDVTCRTVGGGAQQSSLP